MITEDYVSFEVAKLLKEKGFDIYGDGSFGSETEIHREYSPSGKIKELYSSKPHKDGYPAPTHQMVLKWLREVHKYFIGIGFKKGSYLFIIKDIKKNLEIGISDKEFITYEEACEAAIEYCLTNLI